MSTKNAAAAKAKTGTEVATRSMTSNEIVEAINTNGLMGIEPEDLFLQLESMDDDNFVSLAGQYFTMEENKKYNIVATRLTTIPNKFKTEATPNAPDEVEAVQFSMFNSERKVEQLITCEAVLLSEVKKADAKNQLPLAYRITTGVKKAVKAGVGKYLDMKVAVLYGAAPEETTAE